jgi:transposase-like protein
VDSGRWLVDETSVKVSDVWRSRYHAIGQFGQVIDVFASKRGDTVAARQFFTDAISDEAMELWVMTVCSTARVRHSRRGG